MNWISVEERQAEEGATVLVIDAEGEHYVAVSCRGLYCPRGPGLGAYRNITHWMPLPEPPDTRPFYTFWAGVHDAGVRHKVLGNVFTFTQGDAAMCMVNADRLCDQLNAIWKSDKGSKDE